MEYYNVTDLVDEDSDKERNKDNYEDIEEESDEDIE